ncbi:hypothetical protein B0T22DRAFT_473761 [Podospora appendiculata]|uniref:Uncharacterized protein n=1 Tax=Podospora appendiculata TaxID=314037 RepID=A0AAE0WZ27_9PEZI|nr:hypothetical protein B0T22DRAFT_473761 [Podospora appendiculata]
MARPAGEGGVGVLSWYVLVFRGRVFLFCCSPRHHEAFCSALGGWMWFRCWRLWVCRVLGRCGDIGDDVYFRLVHGWCMMDITCWILL